ncbi:MAG TPA: hypothetical protein VK151_02325 [Fluviicola sp.]|nr:hypothetical protein [Fluviicola sp.]
MHKNFSAIFAIPFVLLILFSCSFSGGQGIPEDKKDYIGTWTSTEIYLDISENGNVDYKRESAGGSTTSIKAPIQKFEGNSFVVGALGFDTKFVVSKPPHEENGVWTMTVDGRELTKTTFQNF